MMRGVGGGIMQLQPTTGMNAMNGFLQSFPVQNIPGLGNVQVIPASALQQANIQTMPSNGTSTQIVTAPTVHIEGNDPSKWQILQTIQSNPAPSTPAPPAQQYQTATATVAETDPNKQHRRRVACTCPNCGDGDR